MVVVEDSIPASAKHDSALIGEHFSAWRRPNGLKLVDLAERSGVSVNTLRDLENGKGRTGLIAVLAIARVLGVDNLRPEALDPFSAEIGHALALEELPPRVR
jgi:transcriptional regulator with XRE-family HTH domain